MENLPEDVFVMYAASVGEKARDNSIFIDQWIAQYANSFMVEDIEFVAATLSNSVFHLNKREQRPQFSSNLNGRCKAGYYSGQTAV